MFHQSTVIHFYTIAYYCCTFFQYSLFSCCTHLKFHFSHITLFLRCNFFMLTFFILHFFNVSFFFILHAFHLALFHIALLRDVLFFVALISNSALENLQFFNVVLFPCCTFQKFREIKFRLANIRSWIEPSSKI